MSLAGVIAEYKSDMTCDLAETYQIYDYRRVPGRLLGTLVAGLGINSRVKKKLFGVQNDVPDSLLLAKILDDIGILKWWKTKDGSKGKNPPEQITRWMLGVSDEDREHMSREAVTFKSGADFDAERNRLLRKHKWQQT